ncbi:MAG: transcriptional regulator [Gammaproteobacteria bacterium]|nr:transcriptional regulator [Gammaproteobacteria bacterium]
MDAPYNEIAKGLADAIAHAEGKKGRAMSHEPKPVDVNAIRHKTGMSRQQFCATFGISPETLRHWEQRLRAPRGPARVLLRVVERNPQAVIKAARAR